MTSEVVITYVVKALHVHDGYSLARQTSAKINFGEGLVTLTYTMVYYLKNHEEACTSLWLHDSEKWCDCMLPA